MNPRIIRPAWPDYRPAEAAAARAIVVAFLGEQRETVRRALQAEDEREAEAVLAALDAAARVWGGVAR